MGNNSGARPVHHFCAPVPEQVLAVAILQSDQFCAVTGNLRNQAFAPDHY